MRTLIIILIATLAGCAGPPQEAGPTATLEIEVLGDAERAIGLNVSGAWIKALGEERWVRVIDAGTVLSLGNGSVAMAEVPIGVYDRTRVVLAGVDADGVAHTLVEGGFELPMNLTLPENTVTRATFGIAWNDALFQAAEGPAFLPVLNRLEVQRDGESLYELAAEEIETAPTKSPVARIEGFDANGLRFFQSDFIADSPSAFVLAGGPNLTFQASSSEAVEAGATLDKYRWDFGDGTTGEGGSVEHAYPLEGGKFTVRLTVVDSNGVEDSQTLKIGVQPGRFAASQSDTGTATGVYATGCSGNGQGTGGDSKTFTVDAGMTPDGRVADLVSIKVRTYALGNPHAAADLDIRVVDPDGNTVGSSSEDGTSEAVAATYAAGEAPSGDWTVDVRPCLAYDVDYEVVLEGVWEGRGSEAFLDWLLDYNDGHEHKH